MDGPRAKYRVIGMEGIFVVIILLVSAGIFFASRTPAAERPVREKAVTPPDSTWPYASVSIMATKKCCEAGQQLIGRRFLIREAPKVPLARCTSSSCKCGYIKHTDRRDSEEDRRALYGLRSELHVLDSGKERRIRKGRRQSDFALA